MVIKVRLSILGILAWAVVSVPHMSYPALAHVYGAGIWSSRTCPSLGCHIHIVPFLTHEQWKCHSCSLDSTLITQVTGTTSCVSRGIEVMSLTVQSAYWGIQVLERVLCASVH